jgi:hypothetical protein
MRVIRGLAGMAAIAVVGSIVGCQQSNENTSGIQPLGNVGGAVAGEKPPRNQQDYKKQYEAQQKAMSSRGGAYAQQSGQGSSGR